MSSDAIRDVLTSWARATALDLRDEILRNHDPQVMIYDVLAPLRYEGAEAYRLSWDDWHPDTQGEAVFDLHELKIDAGSDVGFAYGLIRCGGTLPDGSQFEDLVRATFCLRRFDTKWRIVHQHISKPIGTD